MSGLTELLSDSPTAWSSNSCVCGGRINPSPAATVRACSCTVRVDRSFSAGSGRRARWDRRIGFVLVVRVQVVVVIITQKPKAIMLV